MPQENLGRRFASDYNKWIMLRHEQGPQRLHVDEYELWQQTKESWLKLKRQIDQFYMSMYK